MGRKGQPRKPGCAAGAEFIELGELPPPGPGLRAVRVAVRAALEERTRLYVKGGTNRDTNTNTGPPALVGGDPVSGENLVDVDTKGLEAEAAAVEIPAEPGAPAESAAEASGDGAPPGELTMEQLQAHIPAWKPGTDIIANTFGDLIAPNWKLTRAERDELSGNLALALSAWFPDDYIPIKYLMLLNVGASIWNLAASRRDPKTGKLLPMRLAAPEGGATTEGAKTDTPAAAASAEPVTTSTASGATTST